MKNPILELRERAERTRSEFAEDLGCSYGDLAEAEDGRTGCISEAVLCGLTRRGYPTEVIMFDFARWLLERRGDSQRPLSFLDPCLQGMSLEQFREKMTETAKKAQENRCPSE